MAEQSQKKVYTSFDELSPREFMYIPEGSLEGVYPRRFSGLELVHLFVAMVVLTVAFSLMRSKNFLLSASFFDVDSFVGALPMVLLGIVSAFVVHELCHKFVAQRLGLWSEFRVYPYGLLFALFLAVLTGVVFAAPGAVLFRGSPRLFEEGRIAVSGSLANLVIAGVCLPLLMFVFPITTFIGTVLGFVCLVNSSLGLFNVLPFGPLDGAKILRWNGIVWALVFSFAVFVLLSVYWYVPGVLGL